MVLPLPDSDQGKELAAVERQADAVDRASDLAAAPAKAVAQRAFQGEMHREIAHLEQMLAAVPADARHESLPCAAAWQATT